MELRFKFTLKLQPFNITVSADKHSDNNGTTYTIYTNEFRPQTCLAFPNEQDFKNDTNFMIKQFETTMMNRNEDYIFPIVAMCQKHIQQYGRIVDNDLYIYIDQMTLILKEAFKQQGKVLSHSKGQELWNLSKNTLFSVFKDSIWVDKSHYLGFGPNELVQYTSIVHEF